MTTTVPASDLNITLTGRKYRKHNTRIIARLRAKFKDKCFYYRDGLYEMFTEEDYIAGRGPHHKLTAEQALRLLEDSTPATAAA